MNLCSHRTLYVLAATVVAAALSGCAAFRAEVDDKDPAASSPLSAKYDQSDLLEWATLISGDILAHPFPAAGEKPIIVDMGIQNRTKSHMDMKALSDTISIKLLASGKMQFVNSARRDDLLREQGYQLDNCTRATQARVGQQLGAKYMLTGSLVEIERRSERQVRVSEQQDIYYQLTVELTDLETGLITVMKQRDRLRRASKPIIGW